MKELQKQTKETKKNRSTGAVIANGQPVAVELPCTIEAFLRAQNLLPRSVVVEQNGAAVAPSEFSKREVREGDRLEIVRIVAGG
jgi:sulfur carrier protein